MTTILLSTEPFSGDRGLSRVLVQGERDTTSVVLLRGAWGHLANPFFDAPELWRGGFQDLPYTISVLLSLRAWGLLFAEL